MRGIGYELQVSLDVVVTLGADAHVRESSGTESFDFAWLDAARRYELRNARPGDALVEAQALLVIDG